MEPHPVRMVVRDDLERSRLTVFFRLLLAIPHLLWLALWSFGAFFVAVIAWVWTLLAGRPSDSLAEFFAAYVRYATHVYAFVLLAANPFPGFLGTAGSYPIDLEIDPPQPQSRWKTGLRLLVALPALLISGILLGAPGGGGSGGGGSGWEGSGDEWGYYGSAAGVGVAVAFLAWFAILVRGRMPRGFRDLLAYALRYSAQTWGYLLFLTDRYPDADPAAPPHAPPPSPRPVELIRADEDLRRSRLTVFFRLLLALPHFVWLVLWSVAALLALVAGWLAGLFLGRLPTPIHRFLAAFLRYQIHVFSFLFLVANPFPGFAGAAGSYPVDVRVDAPERQSRLTIVFRGLLAIPALIVANGLTLALFAAGFLGWFAALLTARMPHGLRELGAWALGYTAQTNGYLYLLTDRYPYSGPPAADVPAVEEEAVPAWPAPPASASP